MITPRPRPTPHSSWLSRFGFLVVVLLLGLSPRPGSAQRQSNAEKSYALIFGTVWGPDNRPVYGIHVKIRPAKNKKNKAKWEVYSDHMGEFAQRVPPGDADYILWADLKGVKTTDGTPLHLANEVTVHVYYDEREDTGLHLIK